ncbi:hypothetical protein ACS0TY_016845 [Phlomoides rotata]
MRIVDRKSALNMMLLNTVVIISVGIIILTLNKRRRRAGVHRRIFTILDRIPAQMKNMSYLCEVSDVDCRDQLRMDRATFHKLCFILQSVCGLKSSRRVCVPEKVAMFLSILSHHTKNKCVKFAFKRSGQTISKHFHAVLNSVLRLHAMFLVRPQPITEDNTDQRWHQFQGFLGALDGTHIDVHVPVSDKGRVMDQFGNQTGQDMERAKVSRGLRSWSKIEEDALILCLTNVVLEGWKSENGFKAGFQRELEKGMRKIIPSTDLVANPHINSKIHVWKKEYGALSDLFSKSGIGWNSTTSILEIEDEGVWESCKRADPHVKGLRYKTWPYFPQWVEIFGKNRATGENAVDPIDLINELYRTGLDHEGDTGDKYVPLTPEYMNDGEDDCGDKHVDLPTKAFTKGKKCKSNDSDITMLVDSLGEFMKFSKGAMTDLCSGVEKGSTSNNDTTQLNCIIKEIVGLKVSDKLKVCDELVQNSKRLEFFLTLPLEEQEEYVWMLLDDRLLRVFLDWKYSVFYRLCLGLYLYKPTVYFHLCYFRYS